MFFFYNSQPRHSFRKEEMSKLILQYFNEAFKYIIFVMIVKYFLYIYIYIYIVLSGNNEIVIENCYNEPIYRKRFILI